MATNRQPTEGELQATTERVIAALEIRRHSKEPQLRAEASRSTPPPWSSGQSTAPTSGVKEVGEHALEIHDLSEVLRYDDADFVFVAFEIILGRWPTVRESDRYVALLRNREMTKIGVLGELRFANAEGRKRKTRLKGLLTAFLWEKRFRVPVLGHAFRWVEAQAKLPRAIAHLETIERAIEVEQRLASPEALRSDRAILKSIDRQLAELRQRVAGEGIAATTAAPAPVGNAAASLDPEIGDRIYASIEEAFRGSPEEVKRRLRTHLRLIHEAGAGTPERPVVDLACGRGEWLDLLKGEGFAARGVDKNKRFVTENRARNLVVDEADLFEYLSELDDGCVGAVTSFHLIEHLEFPALVRLFTEAHRVLLPGGIAIFETPNPENLLIATRNFYLDPTHLRPVPPELARCLLMACGFKAVDIHRLQPAAQADKVPDDGTEIVRQFNYYFYCPMDYAAVARKESGNSGP